MSGVPHGSLVRDKFVFKDNGIPLEKVTILKSIGILIDEKLNWKPYFIE